MKPEPLKNKREDTNETTNFIRYAYSEEDIKSAVEWLEEQDNILWLKFDTGILCELDLRTGLNKNRKNAFEDVRK